MRALASVAVALAALLPARATRAQHTIEELPGPHYDVGNEGWNGLSTLEAVARGMGLEVVQHSTVSWNDLDRTDILILLYPTHKLDGAHLTAFVRNGGRVLLGDDFGASDQALGGLGILRGPGGAASADAYYDDQPFAPIARPLRRDHPLVEGVDELTTNYPAVWRAMRGPEAILGFKDGSAVVASVEMQDGRLIALADPSVLINRMLEFDGNLAFAINALRWLSRPGESRRLVILTGDLSLYGSPSRAMGDDSSEGGVKGVLGDFNRWLIELNDYLLTDRALRVVGITTALLVALLAMAALPRARRNALDGSWTRARGGAAIKTAEQLLRELDQSGRRTNFALPAAILRDSVNSRLALVIGQPDPLFALPESALIRGLGERSGSGAVMALKAIYPTLRALPSRSQASSDWQAPFVTRRDFERLSAAADHLYRSLGETR